MLLDIVINYTSLPGGWNPLHTLSIVLVLSKRALGDMAPLSFL